MVVDWCDNYAAHPESKDRTRAVVVDLPVKVGVEEVLLALCQRCYDSHFNAVIELMEFGVRTKPRARSTKPVEELPPSKRPGTPEQGRTCPECGHVSTTRSALGVHLKSRHERGLKDYDWA